MAYLHPDKLIAVNATLNKKKAPRKSAQPGMVARLAAHYFQNRASGTTSR